eukprot:TRINITY_DN27812_c0_g1_i1.p2 TRINITY_DN27812_c0_g1~~TRINITY_DN27812_c0_g1_i1.p2  ORF type:complete len:105 (-),score=10.14 TRINITY_DN27812_c0_g1_i1:111-425(-)
MELQQFLLLLQLELGLLDDGRHVGDHWVVVLLSQGQVHLLRIHFQVLVLIPLDRTLDELEPHRIDAVLDEGLGRAAAAVRPPEGTLLALDGTRVLLRAQQHSRG